MLMVHMFQLTWRCGNGGGKSACEVLPMLFFGWKNMRCHRFSIAVTIPHAVVLVFSTLERAIAIKYISSRLMIKRFNP
jgi:hypothetical protein